MEKFSEVKAEAPCGREGPDTDQILTKTDSRPTYDRQIKN